jgi:predicted small metal-binding protein
VKDNIRPLESQPNVDVTNVEVYRFHCGHEECGSQLTAPNKDDLMFLIEQHLKEAHSVNKITSTLMSYLESTCVTVSPS